MHPSSKLTSHSWLTFYLWLPVYKHIPTQSSWEREIYVSPNLRSLLICREPFPSSEAEDELSFPATPQLADLSKTGCDQNKGIRGTETVRDWGNPITHPLRFQWTESGKQKTQNHMELWPLMLGKTRVAALIKCLSNQGGRCQCVNKKQPLHSKYQFT